MLVLVHQGSLPAVILLQVFESVFQNIKMPKKSKDGTERHRRIKGLLLYLARYTWPLAPDT